MTIHVVTIEDEPELLAMLSGVLQAEGFFVTPVSSPELRVDAWPANVDIFLIDLMLPEHSGVTTAGWLIAHGFAETPKIAMSASSLHLREASESGSFQAVLPKPFDLGELISTIHTLVPDYAR